MTNTDHQSRRVAVQHEPATTGAEPDGAVTLDPDAVENELVSLGPDVLAAKRRGREVAQQVGATTDNPSELGNWRDRLKAYAGLPAGEFDAIIKREADRRRKEHEAREAAERRSRHEAQLSDAAETGAMLPSPANPMAVARRLMERRPHTDGTPHDAVWRGDFYAWTDTRWRREESSSVRGWLYQQTEHATYDAGEIKGVVGWQPNPNSINGVLDALAAGVIQRYALREADRAVACANGVLSLSDRTLLPHSPRLFNLTALPFAYDPNATCPTWLRFLNEVQPHREGVAPERQGQQFLRELFGYILSGRTDLQKIASLIGPTRCGKGTVARVLAALLGEDAVTAPTLSKVAGPFGEESFIGKSLAILGDVRWNSRYVTEAVPIFLGISGEDWQTVARKNRGAWEGKLGVRFLLMSNDTPTFTDASGALGVRMVHLEFTESFEGREDPDLTAKLLTELPGIMNWALDGLDSLARRGRFVQPANGTDLADQVARLSSPETAFVQDCCFLDVDEQITLDVLFKAFKSWCDEEGKDFQPTKEVFSRNLQSAYRGKVKTGRVSSSTTYGPVKKTTYVYGIRLARPDDPAGAPSLTDRVNPARTGSGQGPGQDLTPSGLHGQARTGSCSTETPKENSQEKAIYTPSQSVTESLYISPGDTGVNPHKGSTLSNPVQGEPKGAATSQNAWTGSAPGPCPDPVQNPGRPCPPDQDCPECLIPAGFGHAADCRQGSAW